MRNNINLNKFLTDFGITLHGDSVVRTSYYKYLHPKECFIDTAKAHPDFLKMIKGNSKKRKIVLEDDILDMDDNITENEVDLRMVYPFGQTLDVNSATSVLFNSGIIAYPARRPLCACALTKNSKGKLVVLGSDKFVEDEYFEKEENKKVMVK